MGRKDWKLHSWSRKFIPPRDSPCLVFVWITIHQRTILFQLPILWFFLLLFFQLTFPVTSFEIPIGRPPAKYQWEPIDKLNTECKNVAKILNECCTIIPYFWSGNYITWNRTGTTIIITQQCSKDIVQKNKTCLKNKSFQ